VLKLISRKGERGCQKLASAIICSYLKLHISNNFLNEAENGLTIKSTILQR
jgi:hypothetical protein